MTREKILRFVLDEVKRCGLIWCLCKMFFYIIKTIFSIFVFNIRQYTIEYQDERKKNFEEFQKEWKESDNQETEEIFIRNLKSSYEEICRKIKRNKRKNFQMKLLCLTPFCIITVLFIVVIIKYNIEVYSVSKSFRGFLESANWTFPIYSTTIYVIAVIMTGILNKWINVKRYQETWIRHSNHRRQLDMEILKFLEKLEEYSGLDFQEQKILFKKNIIAIWNGNRKKFEENMKNEEKLDGIIQDIQAVLKEKEH